MHTFFLFPKNDLHKSLLTRDDLSESNLYCLEELETYQLETILYKVPYNYMINYIYLFLKQGEPVPENLNNEISIS